MMGERARIGDGVLAAADFLFRSKLKSDGDTYGNFILAQRRNQHTRRDEIRALSRN